MHKGIAVQYVVMLILGVAVIALLGVWFAGAGGKFSGASSETACRSKALEFCATFPQGNNFELANKWRDFKGGLVCDLGKLGVRLETEAPDCSKILK